MADIRGVRLRKFKLRKIVLGVRMHFRHTGQEQILMRSVGNYTHSVTSSQT